MIEQGLKAAGLPEQAVQIVNTTDRELVPLLLKQTENIDLVIPRGGESLIRAVVEQSRIPVIKHYTGNCFVYVDATCPAELAESVVLNAKVQRPGVCNAAESLVCSTAPQPRSCSRGCARSFRRQVSRSAATKRRASCSPPPSPPPTPTGRAEYLDLIISSKVVESLDDAIDFINRYGSHHTDAILTSDVRSAERFVDAVDSRQRHGQHLHALQRRRRIWPGRRDRHQHRQAPRPRPHGRRRPDHLQVGRHRRWADPHIAGWVRPTPPNCRPTFC